MIALLFPFIAVACIGEWMLSPLHAIIQYSHAWFFSFFDVATNVSATTTGWINVETYDSFSQTCNGVSSGFASYATGLCLLGTVGSYQYQATVHTDAFTSSVTYTYTNYTDTTCTTPDKTLSFSFTEYECTLRTPVSSGDFNFPHYYTYAKYWYTVGASKPVPPYSGVVKVYVAQYSSPSIIKSRVLFIIQ